MKYQLRMQISITQLDDNNNYISRADQLQVTQDVNFEAADFLEVAHVLGQFHTLAQRIKYLDKT